MKTDKTRFIINKDDLFNSLKNDAYNEISEKCNMKFIKSAESYNYNDAIKFIIDELSNETLISYQTFEKYQRAFYRTIETTINKKMFVDAEIRNTKKLLAYYYVGITDFENLQNNIFDLILTNTEKEKILQHYFKKFFIKNDVDTFVKIVFSYELIEYLFFLQADPLSQQPKENDYSALYNELIKKYFIDISEPEFNEVMKYKRLPNGKEKIKWIKDNGADAFRFRKFINFTIKEMNDCFSFPFGKLEGKNKPKHNGTKTDLSSILKRLQP
jgi:hypothetical protein